MKRPVFIIIGAVIVFILIAVWLYLLFVSTPDQNGGAFANLNFGDTTDATTNQSGNFSDGVAATTVDSNNQERLRQLTTVPVLAYREVFTSTSTSPLIYYVEAGTGHIFSITYETGQTVRLSATTIPVASKAALSPNGQFAMIRSGDTRNAEYVVGTLATSSEKLRTTAINENVVDFVIPNNTEILYGVQLQNTYVGKRYSLTTGETSTLFTVPFREATVSWGTSSSDVHYVYPKASKHLEGFVFKVDNGVLTRLPIDGYGLSAVGSGDTVLYSHLVTTRTSQEYLTKTYHTRDAATAGMPVSVLPEKCTATSGEKFICAMPLTLQTNTALPDSWYQGELTTADYLWELNPALSSSRSISNLTQESGRELDVVNITTNTSGGRLYFQDRHNQHLWLFELITPE